MNIIKDDTIRFTKKRFSIFLFDDEDSSIISVGDDNIIFNFKVSPDKIRHISIQDKLYNVIMNYGVRNNQRDFVNMLNKTKDMSSELACLYIVATSMELSEAEIHRWLYMLNLNFEINLDNNEKMLEMTVLTKRKGGVALGTFVARLGSKDQYTFYLTTSPRPAPVEVNPTSPGIAHGNSTNFYYF